MDQAISEFLTKRLPRSSGDHRILASKTLRKLVLGFSDQQLVTDIAILLITFIYFPDRQISIYHFTLMIDMTWFASNTHLIILMILADYFMVHPSMRTWRLLAIIEMGALLFVATILMCNESWTGTFNCPASCLTQDMKLKASIFNPFAVVTIIIFIMRYMINIIPLFDNSRVWWTQCRESIQKLYERKHPHSAMGQALQRGFAKSISAIYEFFTSKVDAMIFHTGWFIIGMVQLSSDRV